MAMQPKKTTIYDLASLAGTSAGTVSAVVNGNWKKRRISEKTAKLVLALAEEHDFALNMQARALSRERSGILGMIMPLYDNRYFSAIAEGFEERARAAGYFPIVTCTQRDPELEITAARALIGHQVEHLVCTGATDPDRIHDICANAGISTFNLDLPGTKAPSVISDNFEGARELTERVLSSIDTDLPELLFVGGRATDHNTKERIKGFLEACRSKKTEIRAENILTCGYAADKAAQAFHTWCTQQNRLPDMVFVNSTISLEGILTELDGAKMPESNTPKIACFDWDPFAARSVDGIVMVKQDVGSMLEALFELIEKVEVTTELIEVPTVLIER